MPGFAETLTLADLASWCRQTGRDLVRTSFVRPFKSVVLLLRSAALANFQGRHAPDGTPWVPLKFQRPQGGDVPLQNTGLLRASVVARGQGHVEQVGDRTLEWGTNLDRAPIHQYGGTITAKNAQMLAIPLTKEAARAGSPRAFPRPLGLVSRPGHPPLLVENTQGRRGQKKDFIGPLPLGAGAKTIFHYVLKRSVTIPARPFIGFTRQLVDQIGRVLVDWLEREKL